MLENSRKRPRKSKLIPRDCLYDEENAVMQINNQYCETKKENSIPPPLQLSIKVEVEEFQEEKNLGTQNENIIKNDEYSTKGPNNKALLQRVLGSQSHYENDDKQHVNDKAEQASQAMQTDKSQIEQYFVSDEAVEKQINKLYGIRKNKADKIIDIELRNYWNKSFSNNDNVCPINKLIQEAIAKWTKGISTQCNYRDEPLCYKCYICDKAWWHLEPFRSHLATHSTDNLKVDIECENKESKIIAFINSLPIKKDIHIEGYCWKCNKSFKEHKSCQKNVLFYECLMCKQKYLTCKMLREHEGKCKKYRESIVNKVKYIKTESGEKYALSIYEEVKCILCNVVCFSRIQMDMHMSLSHMVRSDIPVLCPSLCVKCGQYVFYKKHKCKSMSIGMSCRSCYKILNNAQEAKLHLLREEKQCTVCGQLVKHCMELRHLIDHSDLYASVFKCLLCPNTTFCLDESSIEKHGLFFHNRFSFDWVIIPKQCIKGSHEDIIEHVEEEIAAEDQATGLNKSPLSIDSNKMSDTQLDEVNTELIQVKIKEERVEDEYIENDFTSNIRIEGLKTERDTAENVSMAVKTEIKQEPMDDDLYEDDIIVLQYEDNSHLIVNDSESSIAQEDSVSGLKLEPQQVLNDDTKKLYSCIRCDFTGYHKEFKSHKTQGCVAGSIKVRRTKDMLSNIEKTSYKCTICTSEFPSMLKYCKHFVSHNLKPHTCPECFQHFENVHRLSSHIFSHVTRIYRRIQKIGKHYMSSKLYECKKCSVPVNRKDFFHHWETHLNIKDIPESRSSINDAMTAPTEATDVEVALDPVLLKKTTDLLQRNDSRKALRKMFKQCIICSHLFSRSNECKRHLIEHLLSNAYIHMVNNGGLKCQICGDIFTKADKYKRHMRDHGYLPVYKCELCDKAFSDSSNFTKHKKVHNLEVMICDICKKKFQAKISLEKHMQMHSVTEPVTCQVCFKVFYTESSYKKHWRITHEKNRSYTKCNICLKKFTSLKYKWDHLWEQHQLRKYEADCPICDQSFRKFSDVKLHAREAHGEIIQSYNLKKPIPQRSRTIKKRKTAQRNSDVTERSLFTFIPTEGETLVVYE